MFRILMFFIGLILIKNLDLYSEANGPLKFEGLSAFKDYQETVRFVSGFLPYNPKVIEANTGNGTLTKEISEIWPYARIFAFEPSEAPFSILVNESANLKNLHCVNLSLNGEDENGIKLDEWCQINQINQLDLLILNMDGKEFQAIQGGSTILQNCKSLILNTHSDWSVVRKYLEKHNLVLICHHYNEHLEGKAIFLSRELFHAFFNLNLGWNLKI